jgi:hypothetical protein
VGEQPVLDLVPLGGAGREVADRDLQPGLGGERGQFGLPGTGAVPVGPAGVRWRPLSAGAVLTVFGVMLGNSAWGLILVTGPLFFVYPLLIPASSDADRKRRYDIERELPVYSIPAECHQIVWPP